MSQTNFIDEKIESEPEITNTEQSMQNEKEFQISNPFEVIYNYRHKIMDTNRKLFYLSRRRFLRKQRKQQSERRRLSMSNDLRKQKQMEFIQSFISLDGSNFNIMQQNLYQIERSSTHAKDFVYQNSFLPFDYKS